MDYLADCHTAFQGEGAIGVHACSYLHNYMAVAEDPLFLPQFTEQLNRCPVFTADDVEKLGGFLDERIHDGDSGELSAKVEKSKYHASKKLLDHVADLIKGMPEYILLDEQLVVFDKVMQAAEQGHAAGKRV